MSVSFTGRNAATRRFAVVVVVLAFIAGAAQAAPKPWLCPPKQFDSVPNFNLAKFISAPWFVQAQTPLVYQPLNQLFCVRAKYVPLDPKNLSKGVRVCNYANTGAVNKLPVGTCLAPGVAPPTGKAPAFEMLAVPWPSSRSDDATAASKLLVGPTPFVSKATPDSLAKPPAPGQPRLAGPYWVVAVGASKDATLGYDWAVVTGGAPSRATETDACLPPANNEDGVWLFSRSPVAPKADLDAMMAAAKALRIDTTALKPVSQAKCTYAGAA